MVAVLAPCAVHQSGLAGSAMLRFFLACLTPIWRKSLNLESRSYLTSPSFLPIHSSALVSDSYWGICTYLFAIKSASKGVGGPHQNNGMTTSGLTTTSLASLLIYDSQIQPHEYGESNRYRFWDYQRPDGRLATRESYRDYP
jgi:hypothetical protein